MAPLPFLCLQCQFSSILGAGGDNGHNRFQVHLGIYGIHDTESEENIAAVNAVGIEAAFYFCDLRFVGSGDLAGQAVGIIPSAQTEKKTNRQGYLLDYSAIYKITPSRKTEISR